MINVRLKSPIWLFVFGMPRVQMQCDLRNQDIVKFVWNDSTLTYDLDANVDPRNGLTGSVVLLPGRGPQRLLRSAAGIPRSSNLTNRNKYNNFSTSTSSSDSLDIDFEMDSSDNNENQQHYNANVIAARRCHCVDDYVERYDYYCPASNTHCHASWNVSTIYDIKCSNESLHQRFLKSIFPIMVMWYVALMLVLFLSENGRNVLSYCLVKVFPRWNQLVTDLLIHRYPARANTLMVRYIEHSRSVSAGRESPSPTIQDIPIQALLVGPRIHFFQQQQQDGGAEQEHRPTKLLLRTRIYDATTEIDDPETPTQGEERLKDHDDDDFQDNFAGNNIDIDDDLSSLGHGCVICHMQIEHGDRIGALPCTHLIHAHCLKSWLARRNACPLCLTENIALPANEEEEDNNRNKQHDEEQATS